MSIGSVTIQCKTDTFTVGQNSCMAKKCIFLKYFGGDYKFLEFIHLIGGGGGVTKFF